MFSDKTPPEKSYAELNQSQRRTHAVSLQNDIQLKRRLWPLWWIRLSPKWRMSRGREGHDRLCVEGGKHNEMHCVVSQSPKMTRAMLNMDIPGTHAEPHSDTSVKTRACLAASPFSETQTTSSHQKRANTTTAFSTLILQLKTTLLFSVCQADGHVAIPVHIYFLLKSQRRHFFTGGTTQHEPLTKLTLFPHSSHSWRYTSAIVNTMQLM